MSRARVAEAASELRIALVSWDGEDQMLVGHMKAAYKLLVEELREIDKEKEHTA